MPRLVSFSWVFGMGVLAACSPSITDSGGNQTTTKGGQANSGGAVSSPTGGVNSSGGSGTGGSGTGGSGMGGSGNGGAAMGGAAMGGAAMGGKASGGASNGTANTGGTSGGSSSGGKANGGSGNAGASSGGGSGCSNGQTSCNGSCVDTKTDAQNCGSCGMACASGTPCSNGSCGCTNGTVCGSVCANTQTDAQNCGSCGTRCTLGQACASGQCTTGAGASGADSCQGLAQNITLSQVAVYQTVKIPIMQSGSEVAVATRKTDIVAGKDAMFRLFVTVGSGFTARSLSGRVFVDNGGVVDMYYAKVNVSASSTDTALASTFQVTVPKEKVTRTTQYFVEIVECGTGSGTVQSPRFPSSGGLALGARETGTLKIKVIPLNANSMTPDTSATALNTYKGLMMAMYPITSIDISVGDTLTVADAQDWTTMLDQVRAKRSTDKPAADVYYYGLLKPTTTLQQYCGGGCTAGIGYVVSGTSSSAASQRAALGLAFADTTSAQTLAHEVGHNHGRNHAPCVQGGSISGVDGSYPYANGAIGSQGWDARTSALVAVDRTDIMGYCNNKWISDYTYDGLLNRVATLNGAPMNVIVPSALVHPWHVLLLDSRGGRWGVPITEAQAPAGTAELADVLDASGAHIATVSVYRTELSEGGGFSFEVPPPEPGWAAVQVTGAAPVNYKR